MADMQTIYVRINWENSPSSATALGATNLNKMDLALSNIDGRVVTINTTKLDLSTANTMVQNVTVNEQGVFTITKLDGTITTYDTKIEKIAVNFAYDEATQRLVLTLEDGTIQYVDLSSLVTDLDFTDSDTIDFTVTNGVVSAIVKDGSITGAKLQPNYLADVTVQAQNASNSATSALDSKTVATTQAIKSESYAVGGTGTRTGEDTDNAKYYKEQAQLISGIDTILNDTTASLNQTYSSTKIEAIKSELNSDLGNKLDKTGDSKDNTVTFTEATTESDIVSGETHATLFGKILKSIKALRSGKVNKGELVLNVKDYGAIADGSSHLLSSIYSTLEEAKKIYDFVDSLNYEIDYCAIQKALNLSFNKTVLMQQGTYIISHTIQVNGNTELVGCGRNLTILKNTGNNKSLQIWGLYNLIHNFKITSLSETNNDGLYFTTESGGRNSAYNKVYDIEIEKHKDNIHISGYSSANLFENIHSLNPMQNGSTLLMDGHCVENQFQNSILDGNNVSGVSGIKIIGGTGNFFRTIDIVRCNNGVDMLPSEFNILWSWFDTILCDTSNNCGFYIAPYTGCKILSVSMVNCWASTNINSGIVFTESNGGEIDGFDITNFRALDNGYFGVHVASGKNISILNSTISGNVSNGININSNVNFFKIIGNTVGVSTGKTTVQPIGIYVGEGASNNFIISNNLCIGNTYAGISDNSTGSNKIVVNNLQ